MPARTREGADTLRNRELRQPSIHIPNPGWLLFYGVILCAALLALRIGVPYLSRASFIADVEKLGGNVTSRAGGPEWLRHLVGDEGMRGFDEVVGINLDTASINDEWLGKLGQ